MSFDTKKLSEIVQALTEAAMQQVTGHYATDTEVTVAVTKCPRGFDSWETGFLSQLKANEMNPALNINLGHASAMPRFLLVKSKGDDGISTQFCMPKSMMEARGALAKRAAMSDQESRTALTEISRQLADKAARGDTATEKLSIQCASQEDSEACLESDGICAWSKAFNTCMSGDTLSGVREGDSDTERKRMDNVAASMQLQWSKDGQQTDIKDGATLDEYLQTASPSAP